MAIACFNRNLPGYKQVANNVNNSLGVKVDDKILSTAVYEYAAKKGLSEAADAFKPEYIDELQDYINNTFCINRYLDLEDEDGNRMYEDWYLKNTTGNGIIDITNYSEEQLADLDEVTTGAAKKINATHMVVPMPASYKGAKVTTALSPEEQSIKDAAIKNGTFMKAPNGKPTNLTTEKQWLQVRTKAFKEWFGDWENPTIFTANNVDNVKALQEKYPSDLPNKFYHHSTNKFGRQAFDSREGKKERLHIIGRLTTDKVDVLVVENPNSSNEIAHITLATADGIKPVESNTELQKYRDQIQKLDDYVDTTFTNNLDKNVSKVVDENGEPLVVYHGSTSKNIKQFDINTPNLRAFTAALDKKFYFTSDKKQAEEYIVEKYESIANAMFVFEETASDEEIEHLLKKAGINEFDRGGLRQYYAKEYNVSIDDILEAEKLTNQYGEVIKTSEDREQYLYPAFLNFREPTIIDLNGKQIIYLSKEQKDQINNSENAIIKNVNEGVYSSYTNAPVVDYLTNNPNNIKSAINNNGEFSREDNNIYHNTTLKDTYYKILDFVKEKQKNGESVPLAEINRHFGTNIGFNPNTKEFTTRNPKINGVSIYNPNDTQVEAKRRIDRAQLLNYLANKFNLKIQEISPEEYAKKAGDFSNCCVIGDTVYIKSGKQYTNEQIIEEFLHPAIHALYASNRELVDNLLAEAKRLFPDLSSQIEVAYKKQGKQVQEEELITQVLSKYLNKEISDNGTDTRTIVDYIKQLFERIAELFQDLFGSPRVQNGTRVEMSGADIRDAYSFENLAELINSKEIEFTDVLPTGEIRKNATSLGDNISVQKHIGDWTRKEAKENPNILYVFTDNTDRDSGSGKISSDSWYSKKYGQGHHFPTMTAAVVRGLENSRPISTQRWYHQGAKGVAGRWTDADVKQFKKVIREELQEIVNEFNTGKYNTIMFPDDDGLFNTSISNITKARTPQLYQALADLLHEFGFDSLIPADVKPQNIKNKKQEKLKEYKSNQEVAKAKESFDSQVARIKEGLKALGSNIRRSPNFEQDHTYEILQSDGTWKKADTSVTGIKESFGIVPPHEQIGNENSLGQSPSTLVGTSFDKAVRDFFEKGRLSTSYKNITESNRKQLRDELDELKTFFDNTFKEGYQVITNEDLLKVGGEVVLKGKKKLVAGTMDMLIIAKDGDDFSVYILDMKTKKGGSLGESDLQKYTDQVAFYKELLGSSIPELSERIVGTGLIIADTSYGQGNSNKYTDYHAQDNGSITYKNKPITDSEDEITVHLHGTIEDGKFVTNIETENVLTDQNFSVEGIGIEDLEALAGLGENADDAKRLANETRKKNEVKKTAKTEVRERMQSVTPSNNLEVMSGREKTFLGRTLVKYISNIADKLAEGGPEGAKLKEDIFSQYKDDYFIGKRDTMMTPDVFAAIKNYISISQDFFDYTQLRKDDPMRAKIIWAQDHIDSLIARAFADLIQLEGIIVNNQGNTEKIEVDEDILALYEQAEEAVEERAAYTIDSRTISYMGSVSQQMKRKFSKLMDYKYDDNGNIVTDENGDPEYNEDEFGWGIPKFIPQGEVINKLFDVCHGYGDINQMIAALEREKVDTPWLQQVINIINNDAVIKDQFFTVLRKNESSYMKTYVEVNWEKGEDGKYHKVERWISKPLADNNIVNKIVTGVTSQLNAGEVVILDKNSNLPAGVYIPSQYGIDSLRDDIDALKSKKSGMTKMRRIHKLEDILSDIGITTVDNLASIRYSELNGVINNITTYIRKLLDAIDGKSKVSFPAVLNDYYYQIATALAPFTKNPSERSQYDGDKTRMTFTEPTQMQTIIGRLNMTETIPNLSDEPMTEDQLYDRLFSEKYDKYWQFGYQDDATGEKIYRNFWLKELRDNPDVRPLLKHYIKTTTAKTDFQEQGDIAYGRGLFLDFLSASHKVKGRVRFYTGHKNTAIYRIPTMSDKNADERVQFLKITGRNMKEEISAHAYEYLLLELARIQTIIANVNETTSIENFSLPKTTKWKQIASGKKKITLDDLIEVLDEGENGIEFDYLPMVEDEIRNKTAFAGLIVDYLNGNKSIALELQDELSEIFQKELDNMVGAKIIEFEQDGTKNIVMNSVDDIETDEDFNSAVEEYIYNDYLAACNIFNLTVVDPAFHKNSSDLQKRFAEFHSSTQRPNLLAETTDANGNVVRVTDGKMRYMVVEDPSADSDLISDIEGVFREAAKNAPNHKREMELLKLANSVKTDFAGINLTDGQTLSSPTGFWKKLKTLGLETAAIKSAITRIQKGDYHLEDLQLCIQAFKSFVFTQRDEVFGGKLTLVPTQIKHSEAMLFLANSILVGAGKENNITELYHFLEDSHYDENGNYKNNGIDMLVFHSAVKTGATNIAPASILKGNFEGLDNYIQEFNWEDWGKQQEVTAHFKDKEQPMPSQGRVLCIADLPEGNFYIINGTGGHSKQEFIQHYFEAHDKLFQHSLNKLADKLHLNGTEQERNQALSEILLDSISKDSKYSIQMREAFTLVNGKFTLPISDPSFGDKAYGAILSIIKKSVNDETWPGGPIVIRSGVGIDETLKFFKDKDGGWTAEVAITFPTSKIEREMTFDIRYKKHQKLAQKYGWNYENGDIISVEDGLKAGLITEDDLKLIADRIPTEGKYSQIRCRIATFLPSFMGEYMVFPKEKTKIGGDDFDIDKCFVRRKYHIDYSNKGNSTDTVDYGETSVWEMELKNAIFEMQYWALGRTPEQTWTPGSFEPLKKIAKDIDPSFGHKNHPLVYLNSQIFYHNANSAGKRFVGIAALNNTAHALCSMIGTGFKDMISFSINGINSSMMQNKDGDYIFDAEYSVFDGSLISDSIRMFVGASADNAKDAVLGAINASPVTGTMLMGMLRMGIPLDVAIYMMNMPKIKEITKKCEDEGIRFEQAIYEDSEISQLDDAYTSVNIETDKLLDRVRNGKKVGDDFDNAVLSLIRDLIPYCQSMRYVTGMCSINSTKNAAHKSGYDALSRKIKTEEYIGADTDYLKLLNENAINILQRIPFLGTLSKINTELIPRIFEQFSPLFQHEFQNDEGDGIIDIIMGSGIKAEQLTEDELKRIFNDWLVFKLSKNGAINTSEESRRDIIYKFPVEFTKQQPAFSQNGFISNVSIANMNGRYKIASLKFAISHFSPEQKDDISEYWEELANSDRIDVHEFIDKFMEYTIMRYGFAWSPESAMGVAPNRAKVIFRSNDGGKSSPYYELFVKETTSQDDRINFVFQYARNHQDSPLWKKADFEFPPSKDSSIKYKASEKKIFIPDSSDLNEGGVGIVIKKKTYRRLNGTVAIDGKYYIAYEELKPLGIENQFLEYNAGESWDKMATVINGTNNAEQKRLLTVVANESEDDIVDDGEENIERELDNEPYRVDWFEQLNKKRSFKSLLKDLGIESDYFESAGSEDDLKGAIAKLYSDAEEAGIANKHKAIMKEIKKIVC